MKTKLLLIALAFGLMSSTCTPEEPTEPTYDCECQTVYYERQQTGWNGSAPVYTLVATGSTEYIPMECESQTDDYVLAGNYWYRINCRSVE